MNRSRFLIMFLCMTLALWTGIVSFAQAASYKGERIFQDMVGKLGDEGRLFISQKMLIYTEDSGVESINETIMAIFPDRFRVESIVKNHEWIRVVSSGSRLTIDNGDIIPVNTVGGHDFFGAYRDILFLRTAAQLQKRLMSYGIDFSVSGLGRLNGKPVHVIGAVYPDIRHSQVWIDKVNFRPVRLIIVGDKPDDIETDLTIDFQKWKKTGDIWYPMYVAFYQDNVLAGEIFVGQIESDPIFSDDLFDIPKLKSIHEISHPVALKSVELDAADEAREIVGDFMKLFNRNL